MNTKSVSAEHQRRSIIPGWRPMLAAAAFVLLAACTSLRVSSDYDHRASFSNYHTYAWMPREICAAYYPRQSPTHRVC